ncbi:hypothetical protein ABZS81_31390 [Streptomyces sp. NPDC005318]|uniref:hypothetical protein n=1 Tax=Streptomyces sp. NPDC005318 TaxID=3157031 RepID=UPI0033AEF049
MAADSGNKASFQDLGNGVFDTDHTIRLQPNHVVVLTGYGEDTRQATPATEGPTIYVDAHYKGANVRLAVGTYGIVDPQVGEDTISSVRVPAGWKVTLYDGQNLKGDTLQLTTDTPYVGDTFNDRASSLKVERL